LDIPFGHNNHSAMDISMNLFKGPLCPNLPYLLSFSMILLQFENLCIQYSSFGMKMNVIISDVIVLLMDQVSYTRTPKDHLVLTIIMSKALMFLSVEFKKNDSICISSWFTKYTIFQCKIFTNPRDRKAFASILLM